MPTKKHTEPDIPKPSSVVTVLCIVVLPVLYFISAKTKTDIPLPIFALLFGILFGIGNLKEVLRRLLK